MASLAGFVPEIWASSALETLQKALVFGAVANRDYEGEVSGYGDVVKINQVGPVAIGTYTPDSTSLTYSVLTDAQKELKINQVKSFSFKIDDVVAAQTKPKVMQSAMADAAYRLSNAADVYMAALYADAGIIYGLGTSGSPIDITSVNVTEYVGLVKQKMTENNVPTEGRWLVAAPWMVQKMVLAKVNLDTSNSDIISSGFVGRFMGFDIYESNNVSMSNTTTQADTRNMAGYSGTMTFAEQLTKIRAMPLESSFHEGVSGLYVYGAKVVRPDTLACLRTDYTAEP